MKLKPLNDRLIVRRLDEEEKTAGGIIIPDSAKEKPLEARVVSVGPGKLNDKGDRYPLGIDEGARILFGKYSGTEIKIRGEDLLILREEEVLALIED